MDQYAFTLHFLQTHALEGCGMISKLVAIMEMRAAASVSTMYRPFCKHSCTIPRLSFRSAMSKPFSTTNIPAEIACIGGLEALGDVEGLGCEMNSKLPNRTEILAPVLVFTR